MTSSDLTLTFKERLESLKAGGFGAAALAIGFLLTSGFNGLMGEALARSPLPLIQPLIQTTLSATTIAQLLQPIDWMRPEWWLSGAIASGSGFLFGVTYRYIVRTDANSHLKTGAVGAFGLVRGLSQLDTGIALQANIWLLLILAGESMLLFAIAQLVLDMGLRLRAFQPLGQADDLPDDFSEKPLS
ncbi:MAG: hypothetical protein WBA57_06975 [Elainellaceae cyanobacterium]